MDTTKLQTLKGFRDFLPKEAKKRQYLKNKFVKTFELFGFEPLETPTLEYQELLLGKYGGEADKLVFRFVDEGGRNVAMRYDQTVPTSRILAMYQQNLPMPWRRYQIQNAFRAENPQKGRFREFTQCDIDIFGTTSPLSDAELLAVSGYLLTSLGFKDFKIYINDRSILFGLMNYASIPENLHLAVISEIDKLDRKSSDEVAKEIVDLGLQQATVEHLFHHLDEAEPTESIKEVIKLSKALGVKEENISFQARLARGLDYYTSTIYEIKIEGYKGGSVAGGGRYDDLIQRLCGVNIPATGYSWGFDRIIEAMEQFKLFPNEGKRAGVLVSIFNPEIINDSLEVAASLRSAGITAEIFPNENVKLDKQLKYADKKGIKWFIVIGPDEVARKKLILKDLETGHQEDVGLEELVKKVKE